MRYVALLRGIGPANPNMKGEKLKRVFEGLGFRNVHPVIASGNIVFDSSSSNSTALEARIEKELPKKLKFTSTTIIRSEDELKKLTKKNPFAGVKDERPHYLIVTFFKNPRKEISAVIDMRKTDGQKMMRALEQSHGKAITTRTWKTVHRILKKMDSVATTDN